ncbi:hypothetical protein GCM10010261_20920 [Streptomyces pilosus]|nr:hypothetical protein GCM10010261_20920 [Streptomyces pilosus]
MISLAQVAKRGRFDALFIADMPAPALTVARDSSAPAPTFDDPFTLARQFATLDHPSGGRAGWHVVTTAIVTVAASYGSDGVPDYGGTRRTPRRMPAGDEPAWATVKRPRSSAARDPEFALGEPLGAPVHVLGPPDGMREAKALGSTVSAFADVAAARGAARNRVALAWVQPTRSRSSIRSRGRAARRRCMTRSGRPI